MPSREFRQPTPFLRTREFLWQAGSREWAWGVQQWHVRPTKALLWFIRPFFFFFMSNRIG